MEQQPVKPLGQKGYGTIPHLPGSRRGPGDRGVNDGQFRICCVKTPPDRKGDATVIYWRNVPPASKDYSAARDAIVRRVEEAAASLTSRR